MSNRFVSAGLFVLAFAFIVLGGYQCATRVGPGGGQTAPEGGGSRPPLGGNSDYPPAPGPGGDPYREGGNGRQTPYNPDLSLPSEPEKNCNLDRSVYRRYDTSYGEGKARFRFDRASLQDFLRGRELNFGSGCERLYLNMSSTGNGRYGGLLSLTFEDGRQPYRAEFESGNSSDETKYNYWEGSNWTPDGNDKVAKSFHAIFEGDNAAVILKLEDVRLVDVGDGKTAYMGAGKLFYKMFRIYTGDGDKCHDEGVYVADASDKPHRPNKGCWLNNCGPYSCLPNGVVCPGEVPEINIRGNLPCYRRLGTFFGLNIEGAFNVSNVNNL